MALESLSPIMRIVSLEGVFFRTFIRRLLNILSDFAFLTRMTCCHLAITHYNIHTQFNKI